MIFENLNLTDYSVDDWLVYFEGFVDKHTSDYTYNSLLKYRLSGRNMCKDE